MSRKLTIEREIPDLSYDIVEGSLKHLQGQMLTLIETLGLSEMQTESTKSLIKNFINQKLTHLFDMYGPEDTNRIPAYSNEGKHLMNLNLK